MEWLYSGFVGMVLGLLVGYLLARWKLRIYDDDECKDLWCPVVYWGNFGSFHHYLSKKCGSTPLPQYGEMATETMVDICNCVNPTCLSVCVNPGGYLNPQKGKPGREMPSQHPHAHTLVLENNGMSPGEAHSRARGSEFANDPRKVNVAYVPGKESFHAVLRGLGNDKTLQLRVVELNPVQGGPSIPRNFQIAVGHIVTDTAPPASPVATIHGPHHHGKCCLVTLDNGDGYKYFVVLQ